MASARRISVGKIAICLVFGVAVLSAAIALELWLPGAMPSDQRRAVDLSNKYLVAETAQPTPPPLSDFDEMIKRNLFVEGRGKAPVASAQQNQPTPAATPVQPTVTLQAVLVAVILTPGKQLAWLETIPGQPVARLSVGESIAGWRLIAIHADRVDLQNSGVTKTLYLRDTKPVQGSIGEMNGTGQAISAAQ